MVVFATSAICVPRVQKGACVLEWGNLSARTVSTPDVLPVSVGGVGPFAPTSSRRHRETCTAPMSRAIQMQRPRVVRTSCATALLVSILVCVNARHSLSPTQPRPIRVSRRLSSPLCVVCSSMGVSTMCTIRRSRLLLCGGSPPQRHKCTHGSSVRQRLSPTDGSHDR